MTLAAAIERVKQQLASVVLVHKSHERWPLSPNPSRIKNTIQISILDSSYNPPTLAHKALITSPNPTREYDAKLLLLSVSNPDKTLKSGDATYVQRLEMMSILATEIPSSDDACPNIAVAVIDQPIFVGKSSSLRQFLHDHLTALTSNPDHGITPQLTFLVGFDTLERIISPRYYTSEDEMYQLLRAFLSEDGDDSRLVCARRASPTMGSGNEVQTLAAAKEFIDSGRLVMMDIGDTEKVLSSTRIRHQIATEDPGWLHGTTNTVAQYIVNQGLYQHDKRH